MKTFRLAALALWVSTPAFGQADQTITPPLNLALNNYDTVPVGPFGGLEGSAYSARVGDPSAAWFNPAGLSRQETAQISGSAGIYQLTSISVNALPNRGGSIEQLPNYVGFAFSPRTGVTVGAALLTTTAWTQETDSELISAIPAGRQRFAYSADSDYERRVASVGVGYHRDGPWRFGGGFALAMLDLRVAQSVSERIADSTGLRSLVFSSGVDGFATQLRLQGGAQYDVGAWRLGGAMRTPGVMILRSGSITFEGVVDNGASSQQASLFDTDAHFADHLPWEFQGGAAYVHERLQLEVDLQAYTPVSAYALISSDQPITTYGDPGTGAPPTVTTRPFDGLTSASDGVVNVSAGGHWLPFKGRELRIHGGVASNRSPVGSADMIFNEVHLASWTLGLSGRLGNFQFSAGLNRKGGRADDIEVRNLLSGQVVQTSADVRTMGFIYSLAYQF